MQPGKSQSLVAVARDPQCVFVYWGARLPGGAMLRLVDEKGRVAKELTLAEGAGNAYLPVEADTEYRVQLLVGGEVVGETRVRTPAAGVSPLVGGAPREEKGLRNVLPPVDPRSAISSAVRP